jgi:hypothetical protein
MWTVELNILGRRFTHQAHDRREAFKFSPHGVRTRLSHLRQSRAAA